MSRINLARPPLDCHPPFWARGGHLQTLLGSRWPAPPLTAASQPLQVQLADGDRLVGKGFAGSQPVVLCVFHGLGGSGERPYIRRSVQLGRQRGLTVWTINHRGCGNGRGLARGTYHSGVAGDLGAVFAAARRQHPGARVIALGFSLSGNALLLNLGDGFDGPHPKPDAAIAVNPPVNLARCAQLLATRSNQIYNAYFVHRAVRSVREREADGLVPPGRYQVSRRMTLQEFDGAYTAPAGGFTDQYDYYARCSAGPHLAKITVPTVILHAADDPFIDVKDLRDAVLSPSVHLHLSRFGGHMGYLSANLPDRCYMDYAIGHHLDELLKL